MSAFREQLVVDVAGKEEDLTAGQRCLVDRAVCMLGVIRLIEMYLADVGPWKDLAQGELRPVLDRYLRFNAQLLQNLKALPELERRAAEKVLTPAELAEVIEAEAAAKEGEREHHSGD